MANLAFTYRGQGRLHEAEKLQTEELRMCAKVLGADHPDTFIRMHNLALIFMAQGRNQKALSLIRECYELRKQILGAEHPYTQSSNKDLMEWDIEQEE